MARWTASHNAIEDVVKRNPLLGWDTRVLKASRHYCDDFRDERDGKHGAAKYER